MNNMNGRIIGLGNAVVNNYTHSFFSFNYRRPEEDILQIDFIVNLIKRNKNFSVTSEVSSL